VQLQPCIRCCTVSQAATDSANKIWRIDLASGKFSEVAGSGQADEKDGTGASASFNRPMSAALASDESFALVVSVDPSSVLKAHSDAPSSALFQTDWNGYTVRMISMIPCHAAGRSM